MPWSQSFRSFVLSAAALGIGSTITGCSGSTPAKSDGAAGATPVSSGGGGPIGGTANGGGTNGVGGSSGTGSAPSTGGTDNQGTTSGSSHTCGTQYRRIDFETGDETQVTSVGSDAILDNPVAWSIESTLVHSGSYAISLLSNYDTLVPAGTCTRCNKTVIQLYDGPESVASVRQRWDDFWVYLDPADWLTEGWNMLIEWCPKGGPGCDVHSLVGFENRDGVANNLYLYFYNQSWSASASGASAMRTLANGATETVPNIGSDTNPQYHSNRGLPIGQWVNIKAHLVLSEGNDGQLVLYLNNEEIIRYAGRTEFIDGGSIYGAEIGNYRYEEAGASTMILDDILVCADEPK